MHSQPQIKTVDTPSLAVPQRFPTRVPPCPSRWRRWLQPSSRSRLVGACSWLVFLMRSVSAVARPSAGRSTGSPPGRGEPVLADTLRHCVCGVPLASRPATGNELHRRSIVSQQRGIDVERQHRRRHGVDEREQPERVLVRENPRLRVCTSPCDRDSASTARQRLSGRQPMYTPRKFI